MEGRQPDCATIFTTERKHKKAGKRKVIDYLVCNNAATLLYTINLGCIDVNPWTSRIDSPMQPDYIVIDLDPSDSDFRKAIDAALAAKQFFDEHKLTSFVKTSGKTGIHLYIPCSAFSFAQARRIAGNICTAVQSLVPDITTTEMTITDRGDKLYLDSNQNDYADTVAAPYSVRPYKYPMISTPLSWKEVRPGLDPAAFTLQTLRQRLEKKGDLFAGVMDPKTRKANDKRIQKLF
jgi:bifunctional non-homologous end joining protein LigD